MVTFSEALANYVSAIEAAADLSGCEATVIRDLQGRLRLYVTAGEEPIEPAVRETIGRAVVGLRPWATDEVMTEKRKGAVLRDAIVAQRQPYEFTGRAAWFIVERRFSKDAWLKETGKPVQPWPREEKGCPVVSFYGFKGGVGRTTALAAAALSLAEMNKNIVAIDLDIESPGLASLLGVLDVELGAVDWIVEERVGNAASIPIDRFTKNVQTASGILRVVPTGALDGSYLEKLGRVDLQGLVDPSAAASASLRSLLIRLRDELRPDAILLDVRAGLHDVGGITLSGLSHLELVFGVHSPQTWQGLEMVLGHLGRLRAPWIRMVHTMVPPASRGGDTLHKEFVDKAYDVLSAVYYQENEIPGQSNEDAPHAAYRLGFREALLAMSDATESRADLLADEHKNFCLALAKEIGLA